MSSRAGRWQREERAWYDTARLYCAACGAMLQGRYWCGGERGEIPYCSPACEELGARVERLYAARSTGEDERRASWAATASGAR